MMYNDLKTSQNACKLSFMDEACNRVCVLSLIMLLFKLRPTARHVTWIKRLFLLLLAILHFTCVSLACLRLIAHVWFAHIIQWTFK